MREGRRGAAMAAAGTVAFLFMGIFYVWSMFRVEIEKLFGFSAAQLSMNFSIATTFFCLGGFCGGKLTERWGAGVPMRVASVLVLVGFCGTPLMERFSGGQALTVLYLFYGVLAGFGIGMGYNVGLANVAPWFPGHIGLVTGTMLMGFGVSSIIFGLIMDAICPAIGVFGVLRLFGVCIFAAMLGSSFFIKRPPAASGGGEHVSTDEEGMSYAPREMVSSGSFWVYFVWNVLNGAAGLLVINSAANIAVYFGAAASLGMVISLFNGCGRPFVGHICDRVDRFTGMFIMNGLILLSAVLLLATAYTGSKAAMVGGLIVMGVAYGGGSTMSAKIINVTYGPRHYGVNHSIANFCIIFSSFVGPYLSGILQDRSSGGYTSTFFMLLFMGMAEVVLIFVLKKVLAGETAKISGKN